MSHYARKRHREEDYTPDRRPNRRPSRGGAWSSPRSEWREPQPPPYQRIKNDLWLMGDRGSRNADITPRLLEDMARDLVAAWQRSEGSHAEVFEAFQVAVVELPQKASHVAALIALLHASPVAPKPQTSKADGDGNDVDMDEVPQPTNIAHQILERLVAKLQEFLAASDWLSARLLVSFLARLTQTPTPVVTLDSFAALLLQFTAFINGPAPVSQKDHAAVVVGEALLLLPPAALPEIQQAIIGHGQASERTRYHILVETYTENHLSSLVRILEDLLISKTGFEPVLIDMPRDVPSLTRPPPDAAAAEPFVIAAPTYTFPASATPQYTATSTLKLFPDDTVPVSTDPAGYQLLSLVRDLMSLFVANRHEGAKILLDLGNGPWITGGGKWLKSKGKEADELGRDLPGTWILEHILLDVLLSMLFATPAPEIKSVYFTSLLVELCKLSPGTVAPAMGKCVRRLYAGLGADEDDPTAPVRLDADGVLRFAEWFSTHLSNFNFSWRWPEWEPDLTLPETHPKRVFINRLIELEIRLSYVDRIRKSLPEPFHELPILAKDPANLISTYQEGTAHFDEAEQILECLRTKANADEVLEQLQKIEAANPGEAGLLLSTDLAIQTILQIGSKSFSHFLNMLERYLSVLRHITTSPERRLKLLSSISAFCGINYHFVQIIIDKLMRYRILDPIDVVRWVLASEQAIISINEWEILKNTLDLLTTRVVGLTLRLETATAENAQAAAEDQADIKQMQAQLAALKEERKSAIVTATTGLRARAEIEGASKDEAWWSQGWLKAFARKYAALLYEHKDAIISVVEKNGPLEEVVARWPAYTLA